MTQTTKPAAKTERDRAIAVDLIAVLVAVIDGQPRAMTVHGGSALPAGPFEFGHRSLQAGLRAWVEQQTHHPLGYLEQLYTFADRDRTENSAGQRSISISYLGLTRERNVPGPNESGWHSWYDYFPWEDHRGGVPHAFEKRLKTILRAWAGAADTPQARNERKQRVAVSFGFDGYAWNEELVLQRYELLYEASLVEEARRGGLGKAEPSIPGQAMMADHRRILATGIARLRAKIKYRPVVFELMPPTFTLLQLQRTVEALAGRLLHKQNFRRLIEQQQLVEEAGESSSDTGGRPAKLFRFRHAVLAERAVAGTKLPLSRA
jgi:hypothetical protein